MKDEYVITPDSGPQIIYVENRLISPNPIPVRVELKAVKRPRSTLDRAFDKWVSAGE